MQIHTENVELKKEYFPGSQMWFEKGKFFDRDTNLRGFGCGVVACMDFCVYKGVIPAPVSRDAYCGQVRHMAKRFFPIMPGFGIAPYYYTVLLNLFFMRNHMSYRVRKSCSGRKTKLLCDLLKEDMPVIICVGPTLPFIFKNKRIPLYKRMMDGKFYPDRHSVSSHYMTVTGVAVPDGENEIFLKVATWGEILYMKLSDYLAYTKYTFPWTNRFYCIA